MRLKLGSTAVLALALAAPAQATLPIGPQFRVSQMGPDGDANFGAVVPSVAYNTQANQYLVVWAGANTTAGSPRSGGGSWTLAGTRSAGASASPTWARTVTQTTTRPIRQ